MGHRWGYRSDCGYGLYVAYRLPTRVMGADHRTDCVYVVYHYIQRLNKQKLEKELRYHKSTPSYAPGKNKEETHPLTQPVVTYPYTDSGNAFGAKSAPAPTGYAPVASQRV